MPKGSYRASKKTLPRDIPDNRLELKLDDVRIFPNKDKCCSIFLCSILPLLLSEEEGLMLTFGWKPLLKVGLGLKDTESKKSRIVYKSFNIENLSVFFKPVIF